MITHKIGDSIKWKIKSTQSNGTPIDWSDAIIEVKVTSKFNGSVLFTLSTLNNDTNKYITTSNLNIGEFDVIVKNTDAFKKGEYLVDFKYTVDGFKQSSKAVTLKLVSVI